jgi:TRAP-type C4-dicarboxylate transport system permease small subunit
MNTFNELWIYPVVPFGGAFLALIFYEFVYKKTQEVLDHESNSAPIVGDNDYGTHIMAE